MFRDIKVDKVELDCLLFGCLYNFFNFLSVGYIGKNKLDILGKERSFIVLIGLIDFFRVMCLGCYIDFRVWGVMYYLIKL